MATTGFYASALAYYNAGSLRPATDTIRIYAIDKALYTVNLGTHDFLDDVSDSAIIGFYTFVDKTVTAKFDNTVDASISNPLNREVSAYILVKWTGAKATSPLLAYDDDFVLSTADPVTLQPNASGIWETVDAT